MTMLDTIQTGWKRISQATVSQTAIGTHYLDYTAAYVPTAEPFAAQNPAQWPAHVEGDLTTAVAVDHECNGIRVMWAVADTANDQFGGTLWGWDGNGPAFDLLRVTMLAGASAVAIDLDTKATLTSFFYADTVTITSDHSFAEKRGTDGADGIIQVALDIMGASQLFFSYDVGGGTDGTDCITYFKYL